MLYLGVSQTHEAQLNILQALTRKFKLHPDLSLSDVAEGCPFHYTGADLYALCADALLKAMSRKAEELDAKISAPAPLISVFLSADRGCYSAAECRGHRGPKTSAPADVPVLPRGDGDTRGHRGARHAGRL